jgi:uncharacterized protein involved in exopolysaccharide biosynthesis
MHEIDITPRYAPAPAGWRGAPLADVEEERPRHLRDYLAVITRHRRLVASCFVGTLVLTVLVTLVIPRRWSAATRVQISRQSPIQLRLQQNVLSVDDTDHTERGALAFLATQVSALKSRDLAERVIHRHALDQNPGFLDPPTRPSLASRPPSARAGSTRRSRSDPTTTSARGRSTRSCSIATSSGSPSATCRERTRSRYPS